MDQGAVWQTIPPYKTAIPSERMKALEQRIEYQANTSAFLFITVKFHYFCNPKCRSMIRKIEQSDYPRLAEIWESAVLHTHDFLKKEDFLYYKEQLPSYFPHVTLWGFEQEGYLAGFIGIAGDNIEMLFVDNNHRGKGIGKQLILYAINELHVAKVNVNEQNTQAVDFYAHLGFRVVGKSETDNEGKPYPILHLQLQPIAQ